MFRRHGPIVKTATAAIAAYLAALALAPDVDAISRPGRPATSLALLFLLGVLYTQLFEYAAHRFAMHRGVRWLSNVRLNHLEHHRVFHGKRFRTRELADLEHIPGRWWIFPLLFAAHYLPAVALLGRDAALAFLLGTLVHYLLFETTHWFTHVEDNALDRFLEQVPLIGSIRAAQIEHHRLHHQVPIVAFNFNPPYLGDRLGAAMPTRERLRALGVREPRPVPTLATALPSSPAPRASLPTAAPRRRSVFAAFLSRPVARYGTAALVGVAALGIVVAVHGWWGRGDKARRGMAAASETRLAKA
jgi:hypothetical protein